MRIHALPNWAPSPGAARGLFRKRSVQVGMLTAWSLSALLQGVLATPTTLKSKHYSPVSTDKVVSIL